MKFIAIVLVPFAVLSAAFAGSAIGTLMRPAFGLSVERSKRRQEA